jgi:hypothetical protein
MASSTSPLPAQPVAVVEPAAEVDAAEPEQQRLLPAERRVQLRAEHLHFPLELLLRPEDVVERAVGAAQPLQRVRSRLRRAC